MKRHVTAIAKWVFAVAIIYLLLSSGKLSFKDIRVFLDHPGAAAFCLFITLISYFVAVWRWQLLLKSQAIAINFRSTFRLSMLGQFFSTVMPGAVGGDLIKALYVAKRFPGQRVKTVSTIFIDRVVGLVAVIIWGGLAYLLSLSKVRRLPEASQHIVDALGIALVIGSVTALVFLVVFPYLGRRLPQNCPSVVHKLPFQKVWISAYATVHNYHSSTSYIWKALLMSMFIHTVNLGVLFVIANTVFGPPPWGHVTIPLFVMASMLGLVANAIPFAPLGIGVGQAAFTALFMAVGAESETFGSTLITCVQLIALVLNLTGFFFYATYKHQVVATE